MTLNGSTYGVPWAVENIALLTDKALSPTCPATLDDAVANAKTLIAAATVTSGLGIAMQIGETGDAYHWNPCTPPTAVTPSSRAADGSYDTSDMGVGKEGSIAAGVRLQQLVNDGILKASVSYDIAKESFSKGASPYFITGPWQIPDQRTALGANLMVCPMPNWAGSSFQAQPFVGVRTFMQPAKAKNAVLASTFLNDEVMTTEFRDGMFARSAPAGMDRVLRQGRVGSVHQGLRRLRQAGRTDSCHPADGSRVHRSRSCRVQDCVRC